MARAATPASPWALDVAPAGPATLPDTGIGRGWEGAALLAITLLLLSFGIVSVYSASAFLAQSQSLPDYHYALSQTAGAAMGLVLLALCARISPGEWSRAAWPLLAFVWVLLVVVIAPGTEAIAPEINGARRWLRVGITIQPSELAKLAVIVWTAFMAVKKRDQFQSLGRGLVPFIVVWGAVLLPVALEPSFSAACIIGALGALVVFAAGGRIAHFVFLGVLAVPVLAAQLGVGFRAQRIFSFLNPTSDPDGAGFQVRQSLLALGSGGATGVGFGEGRQKFGFLPEPHNDFIFAMVGEEWGFLGVVLLLGLYLAFIVVGLRIARRARDLFSHLLATGLTNLIALQAMLHMGVGLGLVPPTGVSLPFVSYGRSNLLVSMAAVGMLVAIARETYDGRGRRA